MVRFKMLIANIIKYFVKEMSKYNLSEGWLPVKCF